MTRPSPASPSTIGRHPLVSIGFPVWNGDVLLSRSLESLITQDYPNLEILISDNASTDSTQEICESFARRDPRIRYVRQETNLGMVKNFNYVFFNTSGPLFFWHAHDDLRKPEYTSKCVAALLQNPTAVLCNSAVEFIDEDGRICHDWPDYNFSTIGDSILQRVHRLYDHMHWVDMVGMIRREALNLCLPWKDVWGADVILSAKLSLLGDFCKVEEPLFQSGLRTVKFRNLETTLEQLYDKPFELKQPYTGMAQEWLRTYLGSDLSAEDKRNIFADFVGTLAFMKPRGPNPNWKPILIHENLAFFQESNQPDFFTSLAELLFPIVEQAGIALAPNALSHLSIPENSTGPVGAPLQRTEIQNGLKALDRDDFQTALTQHQLALTLGPANSLTKLLFERAKEGLKKASEVQSASTQPAQSLALAVRWRGPFFNSSDNASEAINFVLPLAKRCRLGIEHQNGISSEAFIQGLPTGDRQTLFRMRDRYETLPNGIVIIQSPANDFLRLSDADFNIGRTLFETDRIAPDWVSACNRMDEVWVPSQFNVESFAASGVERSKLFVVPSAVDSKFFDPARHQPYPLLNPAKFNFLSLFEGSSREGWDVLLTAYLREFSSADDVCLWLRTNPIAQPDGDPTEIIRQRISEFTASLRLGDKALPRIELIFEQIPTSQLPSLYLACDCYVAPSRGEGWGRPQHEAMLMERPVIATNWSANTEFMSEETSYLLDYELVEARGLEPDLWRYKGHKWANPSESHLRSLMRQVLLQPQEAAAKGRAARQQMAARYSQDAVCNIVSQRLLAAQQKVTTAVLPPAPITELHLPPPMSQSTPVVMAVEGSFLDFGSLSNVNRDLVGALRQQQGIRCTPVCLNGTRGQTIHPDFLAFSRNITARSSANTEVTVRHEWPPRWTPPAQGAWVQMQPWEFGSIPRDWVKGAESVDQIWCYTRYVRDLYCNAGIPLSKLRILPLGINPELSTPEAPPFPLPSSKAFRFLFVGGTIQRKGADLLVQAYLKAFRRSDDVCLVIKDFGGGSVYAGQTQTEAIRAAQADPLAPEIIHIDRELSSTQIAGLYTACHCLVHPYRGEGFGLPVLEAMAAALPVIVTGGGATDDFATDEFVHRLPAQRVFLGTEISGLKLDNRGWFLEPPIDSLVLAMKEAITAQILWKERARRGSEHVRTHWTWARTAATAAFLLQETRAAYAKKRAEHEALKQSHAPLFVLPAIAHLGSIQTATALFNSGNNQGAWAATITSIEERPFNPEAWVLLGEIALKVSDFNLARGCARKVLQLTPKWKGAKRFTSSIPNRPGIPSSLLPAAPFRTGQAPRLSVCLIARNEEAFLGRCLESIGGLADQIVVVDTGSTDKTVEIARRHGAEVYFRAWDHDFSAARNEALRHARGEWILILDADEELPKEQHAQLRQHLIEPGVIAWRLPLQDIGCESDGVSQVPRLFCNAPAIFYVSRIHEQVYASLETRREQWGLENKFGSAQLLHYGYQAAVVKSRDKINRNLRLLEVANEEYTNDVNLLMNLGLELWRAGQQNFGIRYYDQAFKILTLRPHQETPPELRQVLVTQYATHLLHLHRFTEVIAVLSHPSLQASDLTASHTFLRGVAHYELKQWAECVTAMRSCLETRSKPTLTPVHPEVRLGGPAHCLANSLNKLGKIDEVQSAYEQAMKDSPKSEGIRLDYAFFLAQQRETIPALTQLNELIGLNPQHAKAWEVGACIALEKPETAEFALDWTQAAVGNLPDSKVIRRQYAEALLLNDRGSETIKIFSETANPHDPADLASFILCRILADEPLHPLAPSIELAVSQQFLKRYRQLVDFGAEKSVVKLNQNLALLDPILPSAAGLLKQALQSTELLA